MKNNKITLKRCKKSKQIKGEIEAISGGQKALKLSEKSIIFKVINRIIIKLL